jgi:hypothetical protein
MRRDLVPPIPRNGALLWNIPSVNRVGKGPKAAAELAPPGRDSRESGMRDSAHPPGEAQDSFEQRIFIDYDIALARRSRKSAQATWMGVLRGKIAARLIWESKSYSSRGFPGLFEFYAKNDPPRRQKSLNFPLCPEAVCNNRAGLFSRGCFSVVISHTFIGRSGTSTYFSIGWIGVRRRVTGYSRSPLWQVNCPRLGVLESSGKFVAVAHRDDSLEVFSGDTD